MHFEAGLTNARIINSAHMIVSLNLLLQARCSIRSTIYPGDTETYQQVLLILGCLTLQCHASILGREPFWEENVFNRESAGGEAITQSNPSSSRERKTGIIDTGKPDVGAGPSLTSAKRTGESFCHGP